jgi:hypothetical protein
MVVAFVVRTSADSCAITCLHCAQHIVVPTIQLWQRHDPTSLACEACGHTFQIIRDERRFPRTPVQLDGMLCEVSTRAALASLTITDLSVSGFRFRTPYAHLETGTLYGVVFSLNDAARTEVHEDIVVRQMHPAHSMGAEFYPPDRYNFDLDFYLKPWVVAYNSSGESM